MLPQMMGLLQAAGPIMGDMGVFGQGGVLGGQPGESSSAESGGTFLSGPFDVENIGKTEFPVWLLVVGGALALILFMRGK